MINATRDTMLRLPEDAEALRALVLTLIIEGAAAVSERDILHARKHRLRYLLLHRERIVCRRWRRGQRELGMLTSLIETCKLNGLNPRAYFTDLLTHLVNRGPRKRIDEPMPGYRVTVTQL